MEIDTNAYLKGTFFVSLQKKQEQKYDRSNLYLEKNNEEKENNFAKTINNKSKEINNRFNLLVLEFPNDSSKILRISCIDCQKLEIMKKRDISCVNEDKFRTDVLIFISDQLNKN